MVYIAPLSRNKERHPQPAASQGASRRAAAAAKEEHHQLTEHSKPPARQGKNQRQAVHGKKLDGEKSKHDLLQELTRQAEWNTLVLQREQAALQALQASQTGSLAAQASTNAITATGAGAAMGSSAATEVPVGLRPIAVKANNHMFYDVAPKAVDPTRVPGLMASSNAGAQNPPAVAATGQAGRQVVEGLQHRPQPPSLAKGTASGNNAALARQQQSPVRQRLQHPSQVAAAASQQQPQQGRNALHSKQQQSQAKAAAGGRRQPAAGKPKQGASSATVAAATGAPAAANAGCLQDGEDIDGQLSPFADADWRFEYPDATATRDFNPESNARLSQTFPDSPQFRTGKIFVIPAQTELVGGQCEQEHGSPSVAPSGCMVYSNPTAVPAGDWHAVGAGAGAQLQQGQQQSAGNSSFGSAQGSPAHTGQAGQPPVVPPHLLLQSCTTMDRLAEAMCIAQAYPDPVLKAQLLKDLKQRQYKLELEQQIAEREAARQAARAAAAAREAAEEAARAAAPPPWDPVARVYRRGGGGEPLKSIDGMPVADLRAMKSRLPVPGTETSQVFGTAQQQQLLQVPNSLRTSQAMLPGASNVAFSTAITGSMHQQHLPGSVNSGVVVGAGAAVLPAGQKGFLGALKELKAGPSLEQRAAAATARQQLLDDLQAQLDEKAARAAADAAAEAARAAKEEESIWRYYNQQQAPPNQQLPAQNVISQNTGSQAWRGGLVVSNNSSSYGLGASESSSGAQAMLQALAIEANSKAFTAAAAFGAAAAAAVPVARKGRKGKHVIEAPWLDQLQQQQQVGQLPQQQQWQQALAAQASCTQLHQVQQDSSSQTQAIATNSMPPLLQAEAAGDGNVSEQLDSQQFASALQELKQQQELMWHEFSRQAKALEQLLEQKHLAAADSEYALAELQRVRGALQHAQEQQQALQQVVIEQQQQQKQLRSNGQQVKQQQRQDWSVSQQHSTMQISSSMPVPMQQQELGHSMSDELGNDALDAFMVETQMVPVTVNGIPDSPGLGESIMQLMRPPMLGASVNKPLHAVQHCNRYDSTGGLDGEASMCSIASVALPAQSSPHDSSTAAWPKWPNIQPQQGHKPPASPPILRSDRFIDKPDKTHAGDAPKTHRYQQKGSGGGGSGGPPSKAKSKTAGVGRSNVQRRL